MRIEGKWSVLLNSALDTVGPINWKAALPKEGIFRAFIETPPDAVKVVILGQDPYHTPGLADGLAFSCGNKKPAPSLRNIFREITISKAGTIPTILHAGQGDLTSWARQGVLLLNSSLTTEEGKPGAHKHLWKDFTDEVIKFLNEFCGTTVFMLWGNDAKQKGRLITNPRHVVLTAAHPSPLSCNRGFFGCNHFNKANESLRKANRGEIIWDRLKY